MNPIIFLLIGLILSSCSADSKKLSNLETNVSENIPAVLLLPKNNKEAFNAGYHCMGHTPNANPEPRTRIYYDCEFFHDLLVVLNTKDPNYYYAQFWIKGLRTWWEEHRMLVQVKSEE
jgi:hypothetical protein